MPKKAEEAKLVEHYGECNGTPVVEYRDPEGKHWHYSACGFWRVEK